MNLRLIKPERNRRKRSIERERERQSGRKREKGELLKDVDLAGVQTVYLYRRVGRGVT